MENQFNINSDEIIFKYTVEQAVEDGYLVKLPSTLKSERFGSLYFTAGIYSSVEETPNFAKFVLQSLSRYNLKDWGELDLEDKERNDEALINGHRLFASYDFKDSDFNNKIWIITEHDRSVTTVLFPSEY